MYKVIGDLEDIGFGRVKVQKPNHNMRNVYKVRKLIHFSRRLLAKQRRDNKVAWVGYTIQGNCVVFILFEI